MNFVQLDGELAEEISALVHDPEMVSFHQTLDSFLLLARFELDGLAVNMLALNRFLKKKNILQNYSQLVKEMIKFKQYKEDKVLHFDENVIAVVNKFIEDIEEKVNPKKTKNLIQSFLCVGNDILTILSFPFRSLTSFATNYFKAKFVI